jgi:hypothetical protein
MAAERSGINAILPSTLSMADITLVHVTSQEEVLRTIISGTLLFGESFPVAGFRSGGVSTDTLVPFSTI